MECNKGKNGCSECDDHDIEHEGIQEASRTGQDDYQDSSQGTHNRSE
jgi:hypothetical protein